MSEVKFTKGEWVIEAGNYGTLEVVVLDDDWQICQLTRSDEASHDASLIAAAPEMYAMLADILKFELDGGSLYRANQIKALLAKARGESC
jgi:hypothetical protein